MFSQQLHKKENTNDNLNTPREAWLMIEKYIPKNSIIYEPFYNDNSKSHIYLHDMGFKVVSHIGDFFTDIPKFDIIITNPPFSKMREIVSKLMEHKFIIIAPLNIIVRQYFKPYADKLTILIPPKRIHFEGHNGERCPFDTIFLTNLIDNKIIYI